MLHSSLTPSNYWSSYLKFMSVVLTKQVLQDKGRPLPKFGEWDVNNPASAEGFTVIFSKARDEKKSNEAPGNTGAKNNTSRPEENYQYSPMKKWFCCF
ncbi:protein NOI4-like isoform X1 [Benincasa hispida]|uniref:protein NOI4-like isoform X1 n=2 Tax=Benincasa hispida TaxID=102211 RepID=UPI0018FF72F8|nr:protein NOI4-like isoform X1 [Benincasa hispida]